MSDHHHEDTIFNIHSVSLAKKRKHGSCSLLRAAQHNKRELAKELDGKGRIDINRVHLNHCIMGGVDAKTVDGMALQRMADVGVQRDKMRRDHAQALEALAAAPLGVVEDLEAYFRDFVDWCVKRYGAENILSADVHHDESRPHCHVLIAPIEGGQWAGGKKMIGAIRFTEVVDSFWADVGDKHGIKRPKNLTGQRKTAAAAMVLDYIQTHRKELIAGMEWEAIRNAFERNPSPFMAAYSLELQDKPDKPAKKVKEFVDYAVSPGKGPKRETLHLKKPKSKDLQNQVGHAPVAMKSKDFDGKVAVSAATVSKSKDFQKPSPEPSKSYLYDFQSQNHFNRVKSKAVSAGAVDDGRTVERDFDAPAPDHQPEPIRTTAQQFARVVVGDDGVTRERDYYQPQPDGYDQPGAEW